MSAVKEGEKVVAMKDDVILLAHGSGGKLSQDLVQRVFVRYFENPTLLRLDDAAVVGLGMYLFLELCPPDVVQEHKEALQLVVEGKWRDLEADEVMDNTDDSSDPQVIEGEFRDK